MAIDSGEIPVLGLMAKIARSDSDCGSWAISPWNSAATCSKNALSCPYIWTRKLVELMSTAYDGSR